MVEVRWKDEATPWQQRGRVVGGGLGLEADPLAGGAEAAGATRLAGGRHTRRV